MLAKLKGSALSFWCVGSVFVSFLLVRESEVLLKVSGVFRESVLRSFEALAHYLSFQNKDTKLNHRGFFKYLG